VEEREAALAAAEEYSEEDSFAAFSKSRKQKCDIHQSSAGTITLIFPGREPCKDF